jgi:hypothetical protein
VRVAAGTAVGGREAEEGWLVKEELQDARAELEEVRSLVSHSVPRAELAAARSEADLLRQDAAMAAYEAAAAAAARDSLQVQSESAPCVTGRDNNCIGAVTAAFDAAGKHAEAQG